MTAPTPRGVTAAEREGEPLTAERDDMVATPKSHPREYRIIETVTAYIRGELAREEMFATLRGVLSPPDAVGDGRHTERRLEIAARCEFATPGPWCTTEVEECEGNVCIKHAHHDLYRFEADVKVTAQMPGFTSAAVSGREVNVGCFLGEEIDARFIAHARTDVEWLLARLKESDAALLAARRGVRALRDALDGVAPPWGRFSPTDDTCVFCGMAYTGKDPITCDHDDDCPWVLARAALAALPVEDQ